MGELLFYGFIPKNLDLPLSFGVIFSQTSL